MLVQLHLNNRQHQNLIKAKRELAKCVIINLLVQLKNGRRSPCAAEGHRTTLVRSRETALEEACRVSKEMWMCGACTVLCPLAWVTITRTARSSVFE
jgi:hypothetical protein